MIIVAAPYAPINSCVIPHLGGSKKIASLIRILGYFGMPIFLVNSAHTRIAFGRTTVFRTMINDTPVTMITPFTIPYRPLGKLFNLFIAPFLAMRLAKLSPSLIWVYNGYSFESILALILKKYIDVPIVLEVEDCHMARHRNAINIKPMLDMWLLKKLLKKVEIITCVNEIIQQKLIKEGVQTFLLPSIIDMKMFEQKQVKLPFSQKPFVLGYFGGLNHEKGADILLELACRLPKHWSLCITGAGVLHSSFRDIADRFPEKLKFYHEAPDTEVYRLMFQCDAIVNPHKSISNMGNGVFPFKIFEYLVTKRLVISTELPGCGLPLTKTVLFFNGNCDDLIHKLEEAPLFYNSASSNISDTAKQIISLYSEHSIYERLKEILKIDGKAKACHSNSL